MIIVLCAMKAEVSDISANIKKRVSKSFYNLQFCEGTLHGKDVVVGMTGVGKVMSAMVLQRLIDIYNPEAVIFSGIAGAVNPDLEIGDVVVSKDCMQHDLDASTLGFKIGEIPYTGMRIIDADKKLFDAAMTYKNSECKVVEGRILTGDQFITEKSEEKRKLFTDILEGDAVEMEGASVGFTSYMNNIPFILVRVISDRADGNAPKNFKSFLHKSSERITDIVNHILKEL